MRDYFFDLSDRLAGDLKRNATLLCGFDGEDSDFVRLNHNRVRQAGRVRQRTLRLELAEGRRHATGCCELSGAPDLDLQTGRRLVQRLGEMIAHVPEDPYLNFAAEPRDTLRRAGNPLPEPAEAVAAVMESARGLDLVGVWASGRDYHGFANSKGQRNWHESATFNLDWSCYLRGDRGVKANCSGCDWDAKALHESMNRVRRKLEVMDRPAKTVGPGEYRAYLAPGAVRELMDMLAWGGFGLKAHRTAQTPLLKMVQGGRRLHPSVTLREEHGRGLVPGFTGEGFVKPPSVTLVEAGDYRDCLVDARSGREFDRPVNADRESPASLALEPGTLAEADALAALGTGIYIGNLWYCNFSDRNDCRITGMTRFGTFWVEGGNVRAPLSAMRFDDSIFRLLGGNLAGLTRERELIFSTDSYGSRSATTYLLPGLLVDGLRLTL